jgi:hypothetical protein
MQVASYALMYEHADTVLPENLVPIFEQRPIEKWDLLVIAKEDAGMLRFAVQDHHIDEVAARIAELNSWWERREVPPCTCGQKISWEVGYCAYGEGPRPFTKCCNGALIELATSEEFWGPVPGQEEEAADGNGGS